MQFISINPYSGIITGEYPGHSTTEIDRRIQSTYQAHSTWRSTELSHRAELMHKAAAELMSNKKKYSESITAEMGKVIRESVSEIEKCARVCEYYADNAARFLADEPLPVHDGKAWLRYQPLGVVLAVMPWNFPFWQVFRFVAPALMAGNTCLLKHASNVPLCALHIEEVFRNAGFPEYCFTTMLIGSGEVAGVIEDDRVAAVTLTGSEKAGSNVAAVAGKCLKKSVLELGGSDPFILLADADIDVAASTAVKARMLNCGQSCIAAKRFIIEKPVAKEFTELFIEGLQNLKHGDPRLFDSDYSTLARKDLAEEVFQQVKKSVDLGARVLYGELPEKIFGSYFPPMILTGLKPGMPAHDEEVFGPVACFYYVENVEEAIEVANASRYGLGASVWTNNLEKSMLLLNALECGAVYLNQMMFSDPAVPFGGVKKSGFGRELSAVGIREFTNQKTVWVK